jgi:hypothetical protein
VLERHAIHPNFPKSSQGNHFQIGLTHGVIARRPDLYPPRLPQAIVPRRKGANSSGPLADLPNASA